MPRLQEDNNMLQYILFMLAAYAVGLGLGWLLWDNTRNAG
jgi:hypothetical protein